jgi:uncharacterized protein YraI
VRRGSKRVSRFLIATIFVGSLLFGMYPAGTAQGATPLYATANLRLREDGSLGGRVLTVIPRGRLVNADSCDPDWCFVIYRGRVGYVAARYLSESQPVRGRSSGRGYINSAGEWIPSPQWSDNGPPAGATAQCCDGSYSFSRSRRGTCSHHGGVCQWLY